MTGFGAATLLVALVLGVFVPWLFMRLLAPSLAEGAVRSNYRGKPVHLGLGVVWLVWAGCAIVSGVTFATIATGSALVLLTLAGPLALIAFALGLVDDSLGTSSDRGFKGHFRALAHGRLTTGMLKLIGMGAASLVVAFMISGVAAWGGGSALQQWGWAIIAAMSIALTSNLINLTDLRPGRALKVYTLFAVAGTTSVAVTPSVRAVSESASAVFAPAEAFALALFVLGPVLAVWSADLGEIGMLGDAGANPMGAVAGLMIVVGLPWWGLAAYFVFILSLNLASERVSFSKVIEVTPALNWLDGLGRASDTGDTPPPSENKS